MDASQSHGSTRTKVNTGEQTQKKGEHLHRVKTSDTRSCPFCHAEIDRHAEFCPFCGKKLVDYCTFCGAKMAPDETVCEECGMPADGVKCPNCGTLNVRSFCRKCNAPLTKAAMRAIEKAKQDPKVQKAAALMARAAELEAHIKGEAPTPSEGEQRLKEILGGKVEFTQAEVNQTQLEQEYAQVVRDINQLFEEMLPPAGSTPQEQYNYYSARKVAIETVSRVVTVTKTGWVCNYCGCFHKKPSECCEPWHGGTWIYETKESEVVVREYKYEE